MEETKRTHSTFKSSGNLLSRKLAAAELGSDAASALSEVRPEVSPSLPNSVTSSFRVVRAIQIIKSDYMTQELNLDIVGQRLGITKTHLCRIFKREAGIGLPDYISNVRARAAERLLRETPLLIKEIATAVGFTYVTQLDRAFRMVFGCAPKEYRARLSVEEFSKINNN